MAQNEKILASDFNSLNERLNSIRSKWGLSKLSDNNVIIGNNTLSTSITTLKNNLNTTSSQSKYVPTTSYSLDSINQGNIMKYATISKAEEIIYSFEVACIDYANRSNRSSNNSNYSNYSSNRGSYCSDQEYGYFDYTNNSNRTSNHSSNYNPVKCGSNCPYNKAANRTGFYSNCSAVYNATNSLNGNFSNFSAHNSPVGSSCSGNYSDCPTVYTYSANKSSNYSQGGSCSNYSSNYSNYTDTKYD